MNNRIANGRGNLHHVLTGAISNVKLRHGKDITDMSAKYSAA